MTVGVRVGMTEPQVPATDPSSLQLLYACRVTCDYREQRGALTSRKCPAGGGGGVDNYC